MEVKFGALLEPCSLSWCDGRIEPLPELDEIKNSLTQSSCSHDGWIYPPLKPVGRTAETPLMPVGFSLPATHQLVMDGEDSEKANFIIALLGMLKGMRLQRPDWQHFYKTPITRKLNDFYATNSETEHALSIASSFWEQHQEPEIRKLIFGALHWHLFAQLYEHEFERFNAQYMALDACAELALLIDLPGYPDKRPPHAERASKLCECTGVQKPVWISPVSGEKSCALAQRRNVLIHEAMYGGQPVGFAYPPDHKDMERELTGLVARIYLCLLGIKNEYTASVCTTDQIMGFSLLK